MTDAPTETVSGAEIASFAETLRFAVASLRGDRAYMARIMGGDYRSSRCYQGIEAHEKNLLKIADYVRRAESAERDAARYRWLRLHARPTSTRDFFNPCGISLAIYTPIYAPDIFGAHVDAAIDAAREGK